MYCHTDIPVHPLMSLLRAVPFVQVVAQSCTFSCMPRWRKPVRHPRAGKRAPRRTSRRIKTHR